MMASVRFNGGDDVVIPVTLMAGDAPIDLATGTLTVEVWGGRSKLFDAVFEQANTLPTGDQSHGNVLISETQSAVLPFGMTSFVKAVFNRSAGDVTVSTEPLHLERIL